MDYKYIDQLLERYWRCKTTLEEEDILRAFFSQDNVPVELLRYKALFCYGESERKHDVLGDDFDNKLMAMINEPEPVKARTITMTQRFKPLFKAAATVAIILTLGNAMQFSFGRHNIDPMSSYDGYAMPEIDKANPMAMGDSATIDTMKQTMALPATTHDKSMLK